MPRCEIGLYENVLRANVAAASIGRIAIIGNDLSAYQLRMSSARLQETAPHVAQLTTSTAMKTVKLDARSLTNPSVRDALNNMTIHYWDQ